MNPPFSSTAGRLKNNNTKNAIRHVEQALQLLKPNGRLVAILGKGMGENEPKFISWWKHLRKKYNVAAIIHVNGDNYKKYGTTFGNIIAVIDNNGPTEGNTTLIYNFNGSFSNRDDIQKLISALAGVQADVPDAEECMEALELSHDDLPDFTNFDDVLDDFIDEERKRLQQERKNNNEKISHTTEQEPEIYKPATEIVSTKKQIKEFKQAFDELDNGRIFVRICDLRKKLNWPRETFDETLKNLRDEEIIQLHEGDASTMTAEENKDCFTDKNGIRMGTISWNEQKPSSTNNTQDDTSSEPDPNNLYPTEKFKEAFDKLNDEADGENFVSIDDLDDELFWPHEPFFSMFTKLKSRKGQTNTSNIFLGTIKITIRIVKTIQKVPKVKIKSLF